MFNVEKDAVIIPFSFSSLYAAVCTFFLCKMVEAD